MIAAGGILAYPTEAVFGLGCDPLNEAAIGRLCGIKQRDPEKGLIVIASCFEQLVPLLAPLSQQQRAQLSASTDGPTTWLVPAHPELPHFLTGKFSTLAVRLTRHPVARAVCDAVGSPIVSTSANRSGRPAASNHLQVRQSLGALVDLTLTQSVGGDLRPSRIVDLETGRVIRSS